MPHPAEMIGDVPNLILGFGQPGLVVLDVDVVAAARRNLAAKRRDDPDFWSVAGDTELTVYEALAGKHLADKMLSIKSGYENLHARVTRRGCGHRFMTRCASRCPNTKRAPLMKNAVRPMSCWTLSRTSPRGKRRAAASSIAIRGGARADAHAPPM
jgi:hypothetical protein